MYKIQTNYQNVDWQALADLYERAPLGKRDPLQLERAFVQSYSVVLVYEEKKIIGAGRAICDNEYYAAVFDIAVLPEYQGQGIGRKVMEKLMEGLEDKFVVLTTTIGKEDFYRKFGFRKHKTAMAVYPPGKEKNARMYLEAR